MSTMVVIVGLDKAEVFAALYNNARAQGLGFLHYNPKPMTAEIARQRFGDNFGYFDYVDGRVMKIDLSGDDVDTWGYDRDNGTGAVQRIIDTLRETGKTNPVETQANHRLNTLESAMSLQSMLNKKTGTQSEDGMTFIELGFDELSDIIAPRLEDVIDDIE